MAAGSLRHSRLLACMILTGLSAACSEAPAEPDHQRRAVVVFDTRPLTALQVHPQDGVRAASVMDRAVLRVTGAAGTVTREAPVGAADGIVELEVRVPPGEVLFEASIESNNGTVLFAGARLATVETDGFEVPIALEARAPVLVATPDSLPAQSSEAARLPTPFVLTNRGSAAVQWSVESIDPGLDSCGIYACLRLDAVAGSVGRNQPGALRVRALNTPERRYRIRLVTPQGTVDLIAHAESAAPSGVIEAVIQRLEGGALADWDVTLLACSTGSQSGNPGQCIPDESITPQRQTTDRFGVASFRGLPDGFWMIRPERQDAVPMQPTATTLSLPPGGFRQQSFTAIILQ
jgi:hypothetical protein